MLGALVAQPDGAVGAHKCGTGPGAVRPADVYIPLDSWVYPALDRLHGLGYLDTAYLGLRPWTRRSIQRMLDETSQDGGYSEESSGGRDSRRAATRIWR